MRRLLARAAPAVVLILGLAGPFLAPGWTTLLAFLWLMVLFALTWDVVGGRMGYNSFGNVLFFVAVRRLVAVSLVAYGPALATFALLTLRFGPSALGWWRAAGLALFTALGVLGLTALVVAYLPASLERIGLRRAGTFLRRFWDEDAL